MLFSSCEGDGQRQVLHKASGLPGEIMLVISQSHWKGAVGDSVRAELMKPFPMILQLEPTFQLIFKNPKSFSAVDRYHRNIIIVETGQDVEPGARQITDRWARGQKIYTLKAKTDEELISLWSEYSKSISKDIRTLDRERIAAYVKTIFQYEAKANLKENMGLELTMHSDFKEMKIGSQASSFLKERVQYVGGQPHDVKQGLVVYTYPYDQDSLLTPKNLNTKRNNVLGRYVKSVNHAPMTVEMRLPPTYTRVSHDSLYAIEGRGLWRMEDPIQGGTFVSLTVVDEKKGRVVTVDGYVYSPRFDKRPLLLEIEALIYSLDL
jgi:hypothetical protein